MLDVGLGHYLIIGALLFIIGVAGVVFNRGSAIGVLMSLEMMLLGVNVNFVSFSTFGNFSSSMIGIWGQIFALFVLAIAAAEAAIGLAILVVHFRNVASIDLSDASEMRS